MGQSSRQLTEQVEYAKQVALGGGRLLITGESGTGKQLFAHAIHAASDRAAKPFVRLGCSELPPEQIEAALFGCEPGALPHAGRQRCLGKIEEAEGGTLLLDEVGHLPLILQTKLMRVLEEKLREGM